MLLYRLTLGRVALGIGAIALTWWVLAAPSGAQSTVPQYVLTALKGDSRYQPDLERDPSRKPGDLIAFSGMKPGDKVVDFLPGSAYWTRIFSKVVGSKGQVYDMVPLIGRRPTRAAGNNAPPTSLGSTGAGEGDPRANGIDDALAVQNILDYGNVTVLWEVAGQMSLPEQVDVIWTSDNYHDLKNKMYGPVNTADFNKNVFRALKPGGTYFVVDHATAAGAGFGQTETLHRSDKDAVKAEILAAGFTFDGESNVLANPGDDHAKSVFDKSLHDKTDQFVLRFKKPANAPRDNRPRASAMSSYFGNTFYLGGRTIWFEADGTYQEFAPNETQEGTWFFDMDGNYCLLHDYPTDQRALTGCHPFGANKKPGDKWTETANGRDSQVSMVAGHVYPDGMPGGIKSVP